MSDMPPAEAMLARYYDLDLAEDPGDLDMYLAMAAATDGPILELAAGSGRLAVPLAEAGHEVWAVDIDPHMLERAKRRWSSAGSTSGGDLHLIEADLTTLDLGRTFGLVFVALNSLMVLDTRDAQRAALETIARHLDGNGRGVVDVWLPAAEDLALYDGRLVLDWVRRDPESRAWVAKSTSARYQSAAARAVITTFFDSWTDDQRATRVMRRDSIRFIGVDELIALAADAGLVAGTLAGDYEMGQLTPDSERLVLVCLRRAD
jgi:SAM-dependent methyltransferase